MQQLQVGTTSGLVTPLRVIVLGSFIRGLWEPTREEYIGDDDSKFLVPLVGFYDKTHTDEKGVLSTAPFMISFTFPNIETRKKSYA